MHTITRHQIYFFVLLILSLPNFARAEIKNITGTINSNETWTSQNIYIIGNNFSVASGVTLTIEPGTIIKTGILSYGFPTIYGKLVAVGTDTAPIYFTSFYNDVIGGDTDKINNFSDSHGTWQGLYFKPGSEGIFDHVEISYAGYGGYGYGDYVGIENDGGNLEIKNSNIHDNYSIMSIDGWTSMGMGTGVLNKNGNLLVFNSIIDNNVSGIGMDSGSTTISNTIIKNNVDAAGLGYSKGQGIRASGSGSLTLVNNEFSGNDKTGYVDASLDFIHSGNTSSDKTNRGFEMNGIISKDTTLISGDLPYIIGEVKINPSKTLTLEPGVILKMNDRYSSGSLYVQGGNLIARGTPEKRIYITSLKDDTAGGDTNGDGNATTPAPKNWASIFLENGSKAEFENVTLRYGGYNWNGEYMNIAAAIYQRGATFNATSSVFEYNKLADIFQDAGTTNITGSEFKNSDYSIWSRGGNISISQSSITGHAGLAIHNESGPQIDARNNWWGESSGPNNISTTTSTGTGDKIAGDILYVPFLASWPPVNNPSGSGQIHPVIIVPGIMGSEYDPLTNTLVIDPVLHVYDNLIETLKANGYVENKDLFTFPYEWRDSNIITANLLKNKIDQIKQACTTTNLPGIDCSKVDLVAHSMGGLVAREYVQSGRYQHDVDHLIFLGTPHKGAPKSYLEWEAGELPAGTLDSLIKFKFSIEAVKNFHLSLFNYIHNRPISSVQELLPTFDYLKDKDTRILRVYPNNYPRNTFLEYLNDDITKLLNSGVKITNIIGNTGAAGTINVIRVASSSDSIWIDGKPDNFEDKNSDQGLGMGLGDGTVTLNGAILDSSIPNDIVPAEHIQLPTAAEKDIIKILTGKDSVENVNHGIIRNMLFIQLHSPVNMAITAPDGKKVGKNFETGQIYNEIPLAFYSGYSNDDEYITIPNPLDGEYKIELQGTGKGGDYGVVTNLISENNSTEKEYKGNITAGETQNLALALNSDQNTISITNDSKTDNHSNGNEPVPTPQYSSSLSGSRHSGGEVLGAYTTNDLTDAQRQNMLKLISLLQQLIKLYNLYLASYH